MKVCFFHLKAYAIFDSNSDAPIGGTLVQMHIIAKKLTTFPGVTVSFITGDFGQSDALVYDGIKVYKSAQLERKLCNYFLAPFKIWFALRRINADVYITSSAGTEIGIVAFFCKVYKKKMIYRTAHEWDCSREYRKQHAFSGRCFEYGLKKSTYIVTQSAEHQQLLRKNFGIEAVIIRNSFNVYHLDNSSQKRGVLWVARCDRWKNPQVFIELAKVFPEESFTMICPKQRHQEDFFNTIRCAAQMQSNIHFIDFIPFERIQKFFNQSKVFVGTSEYEGFPNTYLQACMGGTPIVSYKVNPDDFITSYDLGFYANGKKEKMKKDLEILLTNDKISKKQSNNALQYVRQNHDIEKNILTWINLIKN
ncbi:hypothetical protein MASR2M41_18510 [Flammeovirgaceae bacterium]